MSHVGMFCSKAVIVTLLLTFNSFLVAQPDRFSEVVIEVTKVTDSIYMLTGAGGNLAVSVGADGLLLVDDQYAAMAERIAETLANFSSTSETHQSLKYVINTHHHGDHTGGNDFFAKAGATIVASERARVRLLARAPSEDARLPVITYHEGVHIYFNNDRLKLVALQGHTDGDTAVYFEDANVLHAGDLFFNKRFPFIDTGNGGGVEAYLSSQEKLLTMINDDTQVIPGHGPIARRSDLVAVHAMIRTTHRSVTEGIEAGLSLSSIQEKGLEDIYQSFAWAFISEAKWIETLYWDVIDSNAVQ
ncbi:MAG: MBL fold metallo-hydrolase [Luminiphilus sp.]|nr:MBL fold metallo-hydrolase [Luminiphilus sp.]